MGKLKEYLTEEELNKLISIEDEYEKADFLINILFKDILDKNGEKYTGHLYRVSEGVDELKTKAAALLHDTVEDIDGVTFEDLLEVESIEVYELISFVSDFNSVFSIDGFKLEDSNVSIMELWCIIFSDVFMFVSLILELWDISLDSFIKLDSGANWEL